MTPERARMSSRPPLTAVVCPQPLLLLAEYASRTDPVPALRRACQAAVGRLGAGRPERICVVTTPADTGRASRRRPAGIRIAAELLQAAGIDAPIQEVVVPARTPPQQAHDIGRALGPASILVMADGGHLRDAKAPLQVARQSRAFDDRWRTALRTGDAAGLRGLDPAAAARLGIAGRAPLQVLAGAVQDRSIQAECLYEGDPFGVAYAVAVWRCE